MANNQIKIMLILNLIIKLDVIYKTKHKEKRIKYNFQKLKKWKFAQIAFFCTKLIFAILVEFASKIFRIKCKVYA